MRIEAQVQEVLRGAAMKTARLHVTLRDVEPAVVRVLDVPATATLPELHNLFQAAFGWWNYHLHQFDAADGTSYGADLDDLDAPDDQLDEADASLRDLGERFTYLYDFGDDWTHDVVVRGAGGDEPGCVDGQGSCPPEDCGGPYGYAQLLVTLADPNHDEHERMVEWVGNRLRPFDREQVDGYVKRMVGTVPATVRLLLELVSDGVRLTPAGRLPRAIVREVQQSFPGWHPTGKPAATEDDLWPLAELHALLRRVGLLRLRNGVLAPTKVAADDSQVVRRLRSDFDPQAFGTMLIELTAALLASRGALSAEELTALVMPEIGHNWSIGGKPITERDMRSVLYRAAPLLQALDLADPTGLTWTAGPSAVTMLPGATLRAEVWSNSTSDA